MLVVMGSVGPSTKNNRMAPFGQSSSSAVSTPYSERHCPPLDLEAGSIVWCINFFAVACGKLDFVVSPTTNLWSIMQRWVRTTPVSDVGSISHRLHFHSGVSQGFREWQRLFPSPNRCARLPMVRRKMRTAVFPRLRTRRPCSSFVPAASNLSAIVPLVFAWVDSFRPPPVRSWVDSPPLWLSSSISDNTGRGYRHQAFRRPPAFGTSPLGRPRPWEFRDLRHPHLTPYSIVRLSSFVFG